jgi:phosphoribosylanthranilate isomerase
VAVEVKICGITRVEDAAAAVAAGADWLGVVFAGGPRLVDAARAGLIVDAAGGRPVMGVFATQSTDEILHLCDRCGLTGAQLHGDYTTDDALGLRANGLTVWRVMRLAGADDLAALPSMAAALSLALAAHARRRFEGRLVLAGGLRPDTVAQAVGLVRPDAVDVSSGVEILPGIKDSQKIEQFVEAVRGLSPVA